MQEHIESGEFEEWIGLSAIRDDIAAIIDRHLTSDLTEDGVWDTYVRSDEAADAILALIREWFLDEKGSI